MSVNFNINSANSLESFPKKEKVVDAALFKTQSSILVDRYYSLAFYPSDDYVNTLNKRRASFLEKEFTEKLLILLKEEHFEYGYENKCDLLVREQMEINSSVTREWLNKIFNENFDKPFVLVGILRLISRFQYEEISPEGTCMAIASLSHKNLEVKECGIRAFENWESINHLPILQNIFVEKKWLRDYLEKVINNIERSYGMVGA